MMKKLFAILSRDFLSARRDALIVYIMVIPIILAVLINVFAPGLNDTAMKFAMIKSDTDEHIEFMQKYCKVEIFSSVGEMERRVQKRDEIIGLLPKDDGTYEILIQGNEGEEIINSGKAFNALYELDSKKEETTAQMIDFGHTVPPIKTKLINMLIAMTVMLAGMLISMGIVEEKQDNTINAINVTPVSQNIFVIGKSLTGGIIALFSIVVSLFITGYYDINWVMIILVGLSSMILSFIIGFIQGLNSSDYIEAATGVKMIMLPVAGSIAGYELLADKWQWTMYWSPFYWAYRANDAILSKTATWDHVILCTVLVIALSMVVFVAFMPKIRKGLS